MKTDNVIVEKSKRFAIRVVKLYRYLAERKKEFVLAKQLLRSGTSIGANVREGIYGQSKNDFIAEMSVALKECSETGYWLELLHEGGFLTKRQFDDIYCDYEELARLLTRIIKTAKTRK